ncbi:MAG: methyl-accepting chemotaxis protein [Fusobacteriaceae bacterium]|nr:methyl-accepting chemotaxis protein [Fusobacteriaceae bacterium]
MAKKMIMKKGKRKKVKYQILIPVFITFIIISILDILYTSYSFKKELTNRIDRLRNEQIESNKVKLNDLVSLSIGVLDKYNKLYESGEITLEEAQNKAKETIRNMRYTGNNYFWIDNGNYINVLYTASPKAEGSNRKDLVDKKGKKLVKELVDIAKKNGESYVTYYYPKPGGDTPLPKLGHVKQFKPWDWYIGTGFYIDDIDAKIKDMEKNELKTLNENITERVFSNILMFVILALILNFATNIMVKTIKDINVVLEAAAKNGELDARVETKHNNEFSIMAEDINAFMNRIKNIITGIKQLGDEVKTTFTLVVNIMDNLINGKDSEVYNELKDKLNKGIIQLNSAIENVVDNVRNQTAASEESLAALEEITATTETINDNIKIANEAFAETLKITERSFKDIRELTESMENINSSTEKTSTEIEKLKELSNNIGDITVAINAIAEQTNLLALNAAIEAARAGEAGRGFSVVAEEIRKLAEQTNKETDKIENLLKTIQNEVEIVKNGSDEVKERVIRGIKLTNRSLENMTKIKENNDKNAKQINEISIAVDEQSHASKEVTTAISSIADSSTEIESLTIEVTDTSNEIREKILMNQEILSSLEDTIDKLQEDLNFFKVK